MAVRLDSFNEEEDDAAMMMESDVSSIQVRVSFKRIKKEDLDVSEKMIKVHGLKVPMNRFGSWVFHAIDDESSEKLIQTGGPVVAFVYALFKVYPKIAVWLSEERDVDFHSNSRSFAFEIGKEEKSRVSGEIQNGRMQQKLQGKLSEIPDANFGVKLKELGGTTSPNAASNLVVKSFLEEATQLPRAKPASQAKTKTQRVEVSPTETEVYQDKVARLQSLMESFETERAEVNSSTLGEMKTLMKEAELSQDDIPSFLENLKKIIYSLDSAENGEEAVELIVASSNVIKQIKDRDERLDETKYALKDLGKVVSRIFNVKEGCISVAVERGDERGLGLVKGDCSSASSRAKREHKRAKQALAKLDFAQAVLRFDAAINLEPTRMMYRLDKAEVLLIQGEYADCREECKTVMTSKASDRTKGRAKEILGDVELRSFDIRASLDHLKGAIDLYKVTPDLKREAEKKVKRIEKAVKKVADDAREAERHPSDVMNNQVADGVIDIRRERELPQEPRLVGVVLSEERRIGRGRRQVSLQRSVAIIGVTPPPQGRMITGPGRRLDQVNENEGICRIS